MAKRIFYESVGCCHCYGRSQKKEYYGCAVDAAMKVGWTMAVVEYWSTYSPYEKFKDPGACGISGYLCPECKGITVEEFYQTVKDQRENKIYGYTNGAGVYNCTSECEEFVKTVTCGLCCRTVVTEELWGELKAGYIITGISTTPTADISLCPVCRPKITIDRLFPLQQHWYIRDAESKRRKYPNIYSGYTTQELKIR